METESGSFGLWFASALSGLIVGMVLASFLISNAEDLAVKAGVWQHDGHAYRLIRIPSDAQN